METPDLVIPLTVLEASFLAGVREYLASADNAPDHLVRDAKVTDCKQHFVTVHRYQGEFTCNWSASFGRDHHTYSTHQEYSNARQKWETIRDRTTHTDWQQKSGTTSGPFDIAVLGSSFLKLETTTGGTELVERAAAAQAVPYTESLVAAGEVHLYRTEFFEVTDHELKERIEPVIERSVMRQSAGDQQKDWSWRYKLSKQCRPVLVPVYEATVAFEGKTFQVYGSGINAGDITSSPLPVDSNKDAATWRGLLPLVPAAISSLWALGSFKASGWAVAGAALFGLVYFLFRGVGLRMNSKAQREAYLRQAPGGPPPRYTVPRVKMFLPQFDWMSQSVACFAMLLIPFIGIPLHRSPDAARPPVAATPSLETRVAQSTPPHAPSPSPVAAPVLDKSPPSPPPDVPFVQVNDPEPVTTVVPDAPDPWTEDRFKPIQDLADAAYHRKWNRVDEIIDHPAGPASSTNPRDEVDYLKSMAEGEQAFGRKDYEAARSAYQHAAAIGHSDRSAYFYSMSLVALNRRNEAMGVLMTRLNENVDSWRIWYTLSEYAQNIPVHSHGAMYVAIYLAPDRQALQDELHDVLKTHPWVAVPNALMAMERDPMRGKPRPPGEDG